MADIEGIWKIVRSCSNLIADILVAQFTIGMCLNRLGMGTCRCMFE